MISKKKWTLVVDIIILAISTGAFFLTFELKEQTGFLPKIVTVMLMILTLLDIISAMTKPDTDKIRIESLRVITILAFLAGYVLLIWLCGYYVATFLFMDSMMYWLGVRDWKVLIGLPILFLLMVHFGFAKFLHFKPKPPYLAKLLS